MPRRSRSRRCGTPGWARAPTSSGSAAWYVPPPRGSTPRRSRPPRRSRDAPGARRRSVFTRLVRARLARTRRAAASLVRVGFALAGRRPDRLRHGPHVGMLAARAQADLDLTDVVLE